MDNKNVQVETILPYGESIRPLITSSLLTKYDLKQFLSNRGVFICDAEKEVSVPIICTSILSPEEFEDLMNRQTTKESKVKRVNRRVNWDASTNLFDAFKRYQIPYQEMISERVNNFRVIQPTRFVALNKNNKNELALEYKIEREDPTKDWSTLKSIHEARILLKKTDKNILEISMESTANETKELNDKILNRVISYLKDQCFIDKNERVQKIIFGDFTNQGRIEFLLSLHSDDPIEVFTFKEITNIELNVDSKGEIPDDIEWMKNRVKNLIIKGQGLHDTMFLKNPNYHDCLVVTSIEADYEYDYSGSKGICKIDYGFQMKSKSFTKQSEFEFKILKVNPNSQENKKKVEKELRNRFDDFKSKKYMLYKENEKKERNLPQT
ncbi:GapS4b family protein [Seinonella peptonophila]|uniref:GapS4b family protein n=1 Tax=Seinonella peptonophila TaxID=112248 RepID=UPI000932FA5E|nr:hypothetical protein [Seinonella peptonophila]